MRLVAILARVHHWSSCLLLTLLLGVSCLTAHAENRHVEKRVAPVYPELARRMHIAGVVRVTAKVASDGSVTDCKAASGNQVLLSAAEEAVRKWKFVQADAASDETVEVNFAVAN
jgi:TonB family protein